MYTKILMLFKKHMYTKNYFQKAMDDFQKAMDDFQKAVKKINSSKMESNI